jgi:metallo-beta-lactamase family protein
MKEKIHIHFLGAAGTVTGSKYLITGFGKKILVDCGLFQGLKELRLLNWNHLPVNVGEIDVVLLTHAHLDHTGYLPKLIKDGFNGKVMATEPTIDITKIILKDSAKIQEEEAEFANKHKYSKHKPAKPLYTVEDAEETFSHFEPVQTNEWISLNEKIKFRFRYDGHIIGATFIELDMGGKLFVFSGDIGREEDLLLKTPERPQKADVLFIESTYGDRLHPKEDTEALLKSIIEKTILKKGTLIIPSFVVERSQTLMYMLWNIFKNSSLPRIPLIMDSPMGANVLEIFHKYKVWHKLSDNDCTAMCSMFEIVRDFKETRAYIENPVPKIVIAGSGMATGGRVLSYLQEYIDKPETTVLLVGYQAEGTRGRKLTEGAHEIKIYGKYYEVKARIENLLGLSGHADQRELLNWISEIKNTPEKIFIVHGEKQASDTFRVKVKDTKGWDCTLPKLYEIFEIEA